MQPGYKGGLNTYISGLLEAFIKIGGPHRFQIYACKERSYEHLKHYGASENVEVVPLRDLDRPGFAMILAALFTGSPRIYEPVHKWLYNNAAKTMDGLSDIIYTPTTTLFPFNCKKTTIISMHDIQHVHSPEFFSRRELRERKIYFQISAERADYIQASSEFIKRDLLNHFKNLREDRIAVIHEGVDVETFSKKREVSYLAQKYGIPDSFLFFPAQLWPHKNHITVLKALLRLKNEIPIVMTGAAYSAAGQIFNFIKEHNMKNVFHLGLVPFEDMPSLYQKARFLIAAGLYESSSLPVLEAAASGLPIIASRIPSIVEMNKILKINLFEPLDYEALAGLIQSLWADEPSVREQISFNKKHIEYYSWENVALKYLQLFELAFNAGK